jgi:hypothetical protein
MGADLISLTIDYPQEPELSDFFVPAVFIKFLLYLTLFHVKQYFLNNISHQAPKQIELI